MIDLIKKIDEVKYSHDVILNGCYNKIVPKNFTHSFFLHFTQIPKDILNFYFLPCKHLLSEEKYNYFIDTGYIGAKDEVLRPYSHSYDGAFISRTQLITKLENLLRIELNYNNKKITTFNDLEEYLIDYQKGFEFGFKNFEIDNINCNKLISKKKETIKEIYNFIKEDNYGHTSWLNNTSGFKYNTDDNNLNQIISAYEDGKTQGYFYKTWCLIFSQPDLFKQHFKQKTNLKNQEKILFRVLKACKKIQENNLFHDTDENTKTKQILDHLEQNNNTFVKDQSSRGISAGKAKQPGSVDGIICYKGVEYLIEALNLTSNSTKLIKGHIQKLESNYDPMGIETKFMLVYYKTEDGKFGELSKKYKRFIETDECFCFKMINIEEIESKQTNMKILKSTHLREGKKTYIYHILLKFSASK